MIKYDQVNEIEGKSEEKEGRKEKKGAKTNRKKVIKCVRNALNNSSYYIIGWILMHIVNNQTSYNHIK